jgi:hypothetical protein
MLQWAPPLIWLAILGCPLVVWAVFGRRGYKRVLLDQPPPGWQRTAEAFEDPTSGERAVVWSSPDGAERAYVRAMPCRTRNH